MIGEIYLAGALAIFFAIFGWSESIFGLSEKTKKKELEFLTKTKLSLDKYKKLKEVVANSRKVDSGTYLKEIVSLLKGTKLFKGGKKVFDKLRENEKKLNTLNKVNSLKYGLFVFLFVFLFVGGTFMIIFEISSLVDIILMIKSFQIPLHNLLILLFQISLFIILVFGFVIYLKIKSFERVIEKNLNDLINLGGD